MKFYIFLFICSLSINSWAVKVLQVGDSHTVGSFGRSIYNQIKNHFAVGENNVRSIGLAGSSCTQWASDNKDTRTMSYGFVDRPKISYKPKGTIDKLSDTLNFEKPDILIIELGDNFAQYQEKSPSDSHVKEQVQKMLGQIKESKNKIKECYWVGPTWTDKDKKNQYQKSNNRAQVVAKIIESELGAQCNFINSFEVLNVHEIMTVKDGLHFDKNSGELWGLRAYEAILKKSVLLAGAINDK